MATQSQNISSADFVEQLKKEIQAFPKIRIKHPFLKAVCAGTATMDQIRAWAIQDYQFRAAVPRIAMLRYLACTDPEIAQKLWGVVEEETPAAPATMNWPSDSPNPSVCQSNSLKMLCSGPPPRRTSTTSN